MPTETPRPLGPLTPLVEATAGVASGLLFGTLSAVRGRRIFHPEGAAFSAALDVSGGGRFGVPLLDEPARRDCITRVSRGVGLPAPAPDVLGLAVRVLDAHGPARHQDLLLVTALSAPGARRILVPARDFAGGHYSSILPYRVGDAHVLFGATPLPASDATAPRSFDDLAAALADGRLRYRLEIGRRGMPWEPVGTLDVGRRLGPAEAESLRFNPANTGGGIEPVGVVQTLRRLAYAGSQAGRPTPLDGDVR